MGILLNKGLLIDKVIGGTKDYNDLTNKPAIDGVELTRDTTKADLGLAQAFTYKGSVDTFNDLPTTGNKTGDCWNVKDTGINYAWDGTAWDDLGGIKPAGILRTWED